MLWEGQKQKDTQCHVHLYIKMSAHPQPNVGKIIYTTALDCVAAMKFKFILRAFSEYPRNINFIKSVENGNLAKYHVQTNV